MANKTLIYDRYFEKQSELHDEKLQIWMDYTLFSWRWWLGVFLILLLVGFWIKFRKKESTDRLLYAGLFVAILSSFLDMIGDFLGIWDYRYEVFPLTSNYLPWDLVLLPISMMFFIQVKPKISPIIKAGVYSALASFIGLPLLTWIGLYKPIHWNYLYSFPILIVIYLSGSYIASRGNFERL